MPRALRAAIRWSSRARADSSNVRVSSRVSSNRLRSGPSGVSRSPSRTRLTPERARRSARASARALSRKAVGGRSWTPKNRARPPSAKASRLSRFPTGHQAVLAGRGVEQEREVERRAGLDPGRRGDREPAVGVVVDVVRGPRAGAGVGGDGHRDVVDLDRAGGVGFLRTGAPRGTAPGGTGTTHGLLLPVERPRPGEARRRSSVGRSGRISRRPRRGRRARPSVPPAPRRPLPLAQTRSSRASNPVDRQRQPGRRPGAGLRQLERRARAVAGERPTAPRSPSPSRSGRGRPARSRRC